MRTAIYCRISEDREGAGLGIERRRADCQTLVTSRGWTLKQVFSDNDLSAYSGKPRPGYRAMMAAANRGALDAIVAWHSDRLHRSPVELEEFIAVCEEHQLQVVTVQSGAVDLTTPSGRMVARMLGSAARYESEHKSERHRRKHLELAKAGKISGGGTRPYGYEDDRRTIRETEAVIIRQLAERFLAGESLMSLLSWLKNEGIPTTTQRSPWTLHVMRSMLISGRISGQRDHQGQTLGPAEWGAIIAPQQTMLIQQSLTTPSASTSGAHAATCSKGCSNATPVANGC